MDKYSVVLEEPELIKTSSKQKTCPDCGKELKDPQYCDNCGTKPFEKKPKNP